MADRLIKHGFILIFLALVTGFVIPQAESPRLALSAHTIGLLSGILLLAVAGIWSRLRLSERQCASPIGAGSIRATRIGPAFFSAQ